MTDGLEQQDPPVAGVASSLSEPERELDPSDVAVARQTAVSEPVELRSVPEVAEQRATSSATSATAPDEPTV